MVINVGWGGVVVGFVGFVISFVLARLHQECENDAEASMASTISSVVIALLAIAFYLVSRRSDAPFAQGGTMGVGFLIGGLAGAVASLTAGAIATRSIGPVNGGRRSQSFVSLAFLATAAAALTYLLFSGYPQPSMVGLAIGGAMAAIIHYYVAAAGSDLVQTWCFLLVTVSVSTVLSVEHFNSDLQRFWWGMPILMCLTASVAAFLGVQIGLTKRFRERPGYGVLVGIFASVAVLLGLAAIYSWRFYSEWQLLGVVAVGAAGGLVVVWLLGSARRGDAAGRLQSGALAALVIVAVAVAGFKIWAGLGIGVGLLAAWAIALPCSLLGRNESAEYDYNLDTAVGQSLAFGLSILVYRLFIELYPRLLRAGDLRMHYAYVGVLLGVIAPFLLLSIILKSRCRQGSCPFLSVGAAGLLAAIAPIVLCVVWEARCVMGFIFGLAASMGFFLIGSLGGGESNPLRLDKSTSLLLLGSQLAGLAFVDPVSGIEVTRLVRIWVVAIAAAIALIWLAVTEVASCRRAC